MLTLGFAIALSLIAVGVHYEVLRLGTTWISTTRIPLRPRVAVAVLLALGAHLLEVILFAFGWYGLFAVGASTLSGAENQSLDLLYFSLITYTSLGYGDIVPIGDARVLAGVESLVGLVLIAWTASFSYFEMKRYWRD